MSDVLIPPEADGLRLDTFVARELGVPRSTAAELVDDGSVLVDGATGRRSTRLRAGQSVTLPPAPVPPPAITPDAGPVTVIHEDAEVIVVDKPAGMVVHPGAGETGATLAARLLHRYPELAGVGEPARPGIVHRLDRDTSGLLCVARTPAALAWLQEAIRQRHVERHYTALVVGDVESATGTVEAPIGTDPHQRGRRRVSPDGRPARTHYTVLNRWPRPTLSLLRVTLETGRTHQIRVHLEAIDHPVAGDRVYGRRAAGVSVGGLDRPFLHASTLVVPGRPPFHSPLPEPLQRVLDTLGPGTPVAGAGLSWPAAPG